MGLWLGLLLGLSNRPCPSQKITLLSFPPPATAKNRRCRPTSLRRRTAAAPPWGSRAGSGTFSSPGRGGRTSTSSGTRGSPSTSPSGLSSTRPPLVAERGTPTSARSSSAPSISSPRSQPLPLLSNGRRAFFFRRVFGEFEACFGAARGVPGVRGRWRAVAFEGTGEGRAVPARVGAGPARGWRRSPRPAESGFHFECRRLRGGFLRKFVSFSFALLGG